MNTENRVSPQAPEIEEAIIGACLIEQEAMPLIADKLRPEMFYVEQHQLIYAALLAMHQAGTKIDILTVKEELARRGKLEEAGGPFNITLLSSKVASSAHIEYHVQIVHQKYLRREMILGLHKLLACSLDETMDIADTLVDAHNLFDRLEGEFGHSNRMRNMDTLMTDTIAKAEMRIAKSANGITGIPTGVTDLDRMTSGWQNGDLIILAARPSVGKTALALHMARVAATAGHAVAVYSLEMQGEQLADRWLMAASEISARRWRSGTPHPQEMAEARTTAATLARLPIHVDDSTTVNMEHVRSSARLLKSRNECDMIIIDYLQLCDMSTGQNNRNREQEVAQAARKAKLLAKELDIPVVLLSQLNRLAEGSIDRRPMLSQLRESGAIEQDADVVMLLYRPALARITTDKDSGYPTEELGVVIVAKQRNGEIGNAYFHHNQEMTKITDYVPPLEYLLNHAK
ncbi:replicative DNA helicase [uncultured Bacteroides sp.]|uniref:replicative DNA helicase n=1 Tax=uncultured Bacteroides sp. TaxID=162156 RepID=UPI0025E68B9D|nr:replicative DNA helicase [uncultured Bacteroides sp.]